MYPTACISPGETMVIARIHFWLGFFLGFFPSQFFEALLPTHSVLFKPSLDVTASKESQEREKAERNSREKQTLVRLRIRCPPYRISCPPPSKHIWTARTYQGNILLVHAHIHFLLGAFLLFLSARVFSTPTPPFIKACVQTQNKHHEMSIG